MNPDPNPTAMTYTPDDHDPAFRDEHFTGIKPPTIPWRFNVTDAERDRQTDRREKERQETLATPAEPKVIVYTIRDKRGKIPIVVATITLSDHRISGTITGSAYQSITEMYEYIHGVNPENYVCDERHII